MQSVAQRRLRKSMAWILAEYLIVFVGTFYCAQKYHPTGALVWIFAAFPLLPMVMMFVLFGRYLRDERDEYKRAMVIRCVLWGTAGAMTLHLLTGFLQIFEWKGQMPPFSELWVFVLFMGIAKLSYRVADRVPADA